MGYLVSLCFRYTSPLLFTFIYEGRSAFKILTSKPTGKRPLGRPRRRWEDNIRMGPKVVSMRGIELIRLRIGIIGEPL